MGGIVGQIMWNWSPGALPVYAGTSVWLGMPFLFYFINADYTSSSIPLLRAIGVVAGVLVSMPGTVFFATIPLVFHVRDCLYFVCLSPEQF